jgi:hypothetical protein
MDRHILWSKSLAKAFLAKFQSLRHSNWQHSSPSLSTFSSEASTNFALYQLICFHPCSAPRVLCILHAAFVCFPCCLACPRGPWLDPSPTRSPHLLACLVASSWDDVPESQHQSYHLMAVNYYHVASSASVGCASWIKQYQAQSSPEHFAASARGHHHAIHLLSLLQAGE